MVWRYIESVYVCLNARGTPEGKLGGQTVRARRSSYQPQDICRDTLPMGCSGNNMCFRVQHNSFVAGVMALSKGLLTLTEVL